MSGRKVIGQIVGGGIRHHLFAKLDIPSELLDIGSYVVIDGDSRLYYSLVVDLDHRSAADPRFGEQPIQGFIPANLAARLNHRILKPRAEIANCLSIDKAGSQNPTPIPAATLPPLHAPVSLASADDIASIFGRPDQPGYWQIGYTREQGHPISIDLRRMTKRSAGFFGATGTGKSQMVRVTLSGLIRQSLASALIFDAHSEFAYLDRTEKGENLPGLKTIFPEQVRTFSLGKDKTIRGNEPDEHLEISLTDILPIDVQMLNRELNLTDATPTVTAALIRSFGREWLRCFLRLSWSDNSEENGNDGIPKGTVAAWAKKAGVNRASAEALWSKLNRLRHLPYLVDQPKTNGIQRILSTLQQGKHVILSFGSFSSDLDYLLVTNLLVRRISELWNAQAEHYRSAHQDEPHPLVIVIEEAHKFLCPDLAGMSVFGELARELRKSFVVLWLIDQRPSQISSEVLSQLGTRISGWLGNEDDIDSLLVGLPERDGLRRIISSLEHCGQMLIAGWGVPTAVTIRSEWFTQDYAEKLRTIHNDHT